MDQEDEGCGQKAEESAEKGSRKVIILLLGLNFPVFEC